MVCTYFVVGLICFMYMTVDPDELSTANTKLLNNYFGQMVIYLCIFCGYISWFPKS